MNAPEALKSYRQFVVWRLEQRPGTKPTKLPFNPLTATLASSTDPATWASYADACGAYACGGYNGIGFVVTANDPFVFIDLDGCRDITTGALSADATAFKAFFPDAAWEVSQSGKGLHMIARCDKAALADRRKKWDGNKECYREARFVAFGGGEWTGDAGSRAPTQMIQVLVPADEGQGIGRAPDWWHDKPRGGYSGPENDDELRKRMSNDRRPGASFGSRATYYDLYSANAEKLAAFFPPFGSEPFDHSAADQALMNVLAFWTGCNPVRMERLFSMSKLGKRDKWTKRQDYREDTIWEAIKDPNSAILNFGAFREQRRKEQIERNIEIGDDPLEPAVPTILTLEQMQDQLVFVGNGSAVVHMPTGRVRTKDNARDEYAASKHQLETDKTDKNNQPVFKTVSALPVWLQSPDRISVDCLIWDPKQPTIAKTIEYGNAGARAFNTWRGLPMLVPPDNWQEWVKPFIDHVSYLVPDERERSRFLQWLAHIFQRPYELPHTAYLMIATQTGIGRGTLASMLVRALRGHVASNVQLGKMLDGGFNGRLSQKLLATVDEIREGNGVNRYQMAERLKAMLTEEYRHINTKYGIETIERNCSRWLMFSNHHDAIPFDANDRRLIVIENPSHRAGEEWFEYLHSLMDRHEFIASVQRYLQTLDISTFKAGEAAPLNDMKRKALEALESDADSLASHFAKHWPGPLATTADLRESMGDSVPKGNAMKHVIERAGMTTTAKKLRMGSVAETVLIVRDFAKSEVEAANPEALRHMISDARIAWRLSQ